MAVANARILSLHLRPCARPAGARVLLKWPPSDASLMPKRASSTLEIKRDSAMACDANTAALCPLGVAHNVQLMRGSLAMHANSRLAGDLLATGRNAERSYTQRCRTNFGHVISVYRRTSTGTTECATRRPSVRASVPPSVWPWSLFSQGRVFTWHNHLFCKRAADSYAARANDSHEGYIYTHVLRCVVGSHSQTR